MLPNMDGGEPGLELIPGLAERGVEVVNGPEALLAARQAADRGATGAGRPPSRGRSVGRRRDPHRAFPAASSNRASGAGGGRPPLPGTGGPDPDARADLRAPLVEEARGADPGSSYLLPDGTSASLSRAGASSPAGERIAAPDEWRTNVTLGGLVVRAEVPAEARALAVAAIAAVGADFASVDLLPGERRLGRTGGQRRDFDAKYALPGVDPPGDPGGRPRRRACRRGPNKAHSKRQRRRRPNSAQERSRASPLEAGVQISITGHSVGDSPKTAVILEVMGAEHERFRVRWEDGHESIFFPGEDAVVLRPAGRRAKSPAA